LKRRRQQLEQQNKLVGSGFHESSYRLRPVERQVTCKYKAPATQRNNLKHANNGTVPDATDARRWLL